MTQTATGTPAPVTRNDRPDVTEYNFDATGGHVMRLWWDDQPGVVPGWVLEDCQGWQQQVGEGWGEEEGERLARAFLAAGVTTATLTVARMDRDELEELLGE